MEHFSHVLLHFEISSVDAVGKGFDAKFNSSHFLGFLPHKGLAVVAHFLLEKPSELHHSEVQFAEPDGAGWSIFLLLDVLANRLQLSQSFDMRFGFWVAEFLEVSLLLLKDPLESFAVEDHSLHGDVRFLESAEFAFNSRGAFQESAYGFDDTLIVLKTELILILEVPEAKVVLDVFLVELWDFLPEKVAEGSLGALLYLDLLLGSHQFVHELGLELAELLLALHQVADVLQEVVLRGLQVVMLRSQVLVYGGQVPLVLHAHSS